MYPISEWFSRHNAKEIIDVMFAKEIINKTFVGQWPCEISFKSFVGSLVCV